MKDHRTIYDQSNRERLDDDAPWAAVSRSRGLPHSQTLLLSTSYGSADCCLGRGVPTTYCLTDKGAYSKTRATQCFLHSEGHPPKAIRERPPTILSLASSLYSQEDGLRPRSHPQRPISRNQKPTAGLSPPETQFDSIAWCPRFGHLPYSPRIVIRSGLLIHSVIINLPGSSKEELFLPCDVVVISQVRG